MRYLYVVFVSLLGGLTVGCVDQGRDTQAPVDYSHAIRGPAAGIYRWVDLELRIACYSMHDHAINTSSTRQLACVKLP